MRGVNSIVFVALMAMLIACGGGDGDGGGLTAPPLVPQIAGQWEGVWIVDGSPFFDVEMSLNQSGSNLTGTFDLMGDPLEITGTVTPTLMRWQVAGLTCGSITGDAALGSQAPATMSGTIDWNFILCPSPEKYAGSVTWSRATTQSKRQGRPGRVEDLMARLAERRR